jgi:hypothetical protein
VAGERLQAFTAYVREEWARLARCAEFRCVALAKTITCKASPFEASPAIAASSRYHHSQPQAVGKAVWAGEGGFDLGHWEAQCAGS